MTERFTLKEDGLHDKETDRVFQLDKNLLRLLNTLDKMLKQYMVKSYAQDQEIQKLINQLEKIPDSIKDVWLKD